MKKTITKIITVIAAFVLTFTSLPAMGGNLDVHAAAVKAPVQVKNLKAKNITQTTVTLTWSKIAKNKNTKGYAIYRNGKAIKRVGTKVNSFKDTKLKAGAKYRYAVRAYNTYRQKQYYNSKTKKWQVKKPAAKYWKGKKARTVTKYKYGKASAVRQVTTKKVVKKAATNSSGTSSTNNSSIKVGNFKLISSAPKEIYSGGDYAIKYEVPTKGCTVEWTSSNSNVANVSSWDIQNTNRTINVYSGGSLGRAEIKGVLKTESGIKYSGSTEIKFYVENTIYPRNADGSYTVEFDDSCNGYGYDSAIIGGKIGSLGKLPNGATIKINAAKMNRVTHVTYVDAEGNNINMGDWPASWGTIVASSNRDVVYIGPNYRKSAEYSGKRYPSVLEGAYFVGSGNADITLTNGNTLKVVASGRNNDVYNYVNFIKTWPSRVAGKTDLEKLKYTTNYLNTQFSYPKPCYEHDSYALFKMGSGDCWAGNSMLLELCKEMGFEAFYRNASKECGGNHVNCLVTINGQDYVADGTPEGISGVRTWEEYAKRYSSYNVQKRP